MKISLWIPAVVLYMVRCAFSNSVEVGTVLFTKTDLVKKCWTENDKSLLKARLIMQDVLPDPDCIDFSNPEVVAILLEYFHSCFKIISTSTYGKLQNLMYLALSDALGGYLRAFVLPFTRRAYYAGQIRYVDAKKLFQLYDDIRVFLKTNGVGWAEPYKFRCKKIHVRPLVITGGALEACNELYVIERPGKLHILISGKEERADEGEEEEKKKKEEEKKKKEEEEEEEEGRNKRECLDATDNSQPGKEKRFAKTNEQLSFYNFINSYSGGEKFFKNWNRTWGAATEGRGRRARESEDKEEPTSESSGKGLRRVVVPLPILDDHKTPHSIAVPFLRRPFRNLKAGCSAFVLEYYYLAVVKCFIAKGNSRSDIKNFNGEFYTWLENQVIPHLSEEQWYPGFGGVLRVLQTIKKFGLDTGANDPVLHDIAFMFKNGAEFEVRDSLKEKGKNKVRDVTVEEEEEESSTFQQRHLLIAIIIISMIWLFIFCMFAFYCQATRGHKLLYEGHGYCPATESRRAEREGNRDNNLIFQFLVKFFKRKNAEVQEKESDDMGLKLGKQKETMCIPTTMQSSQHYCKNKTNRSGRRRGDGDRFCFPALMSGQPLLKSKKLEDLSCGDTKYQHKGEGDQLQMLWKKPSMFKGDRNPTKEGHRSGKKHRASTASGTGSEDVRGRTCTACLEGEKRFRHQTASSQLKTSNTSSALDGTKDYTSGKQTSTCNCSESCPFAYTTATTTTTTSSAQLEEKMSSATMEFFEEIISKHKPMKSSTQDTTAESESECSTSSETDY